MALILITGASGFLGKAILHQLALQKDEILTIGKQSANHFVHDLASEIPIIKANKIDLVVHAAGKAHSVPKTKAEKQAFFDTNLTGTLNLLRSLEKLVELPKSFVFISSVAVYGKETGLNITEQAPLQAKDPYGLSKVQAEDLVVAWCKKNNVICTILRLPLLVGLKPPGNLGDMIRGIQKGYYFNIGGGKAKKSMVLVEDVAQFIPIIAITGGIYNLTDGENPSFKAFSNAIAKKEIFNLPLAIATILGFIGDALGEKAPINSLKIKKITSDLTFDDSKAREFGWKPQSVLKYLKNNFLLSNLKSLK
jgi:nucleoside-diphosphate-sugar epimerase